MCHLCKVCVSSSLFFKQPVHLVCVCVCVCVISFLTCIFCVISSNRRTIDVTVFTQSRRWCSRLRHCATSRKVAGSIPDGGINPAGRSMALGSSKPLRETRIRDVSSGGKGGWYVGLTIIQLPCVVGCLEILESPTSWSCEDLTGFVKGYLRRNTAKAGT